MFKINNSREKKQDLINNSTLFHKKKQLYKKQVQVTPVIKKPLANFYNKQLFKFNYFPFSV